MKLFSRLIGILFISLIRFYKFFISPLIMTSCRFTPSCSDYGVQAIKKHGPLLGGWYTMRRISSCHPWGRHGHDPVP